jgi:4-amino-4-deoxy-L-arabinose transferase-like glycosyltransferase
LTAKKQDLEMLGDLSDLKVISGTPDPSGYPRYKLAFLICFVGIAMAYLSHLGVVPIHAAADECRRALVAMEMNMTGDYLTPTINGEPYLNKPPLFTWMILISYKVVGNYSAYALRLPVVLSILLHGLLIFFVVRKYCGDGVASMTALAFMTNGRTLIFDSMLGLLEHTLALVLYAGFILIFILGERKKYGLLFAVTYFIAALGFLIKGMPAIGHHLIALAVYFILTRKVRFLFSRHHFAGILVFLGTLALYYIPYLLHQTFSLGFLFSRILHESSKRYYVTDVKHFIDILWDYPLDFVYHFLPWTLLLILLIQKKYKSWIRENKFVYYNILLFLANTPVYWLAALKNPHYLYFLLPLLFALLFFIYFKLDKSDWRLNLVEGIFMICMLMAFLIAGYLPFTRLLPDISQVWSKTVFLVMAFAGLLIFYIRAGAYRLFLFTGMLIMLRLAFNWFVLPQRIASEDIYKERAEQVYEIVKQKPLFIMAQYPAGYYDRITYYMELFRNEILRLNRQVDYDAYYLVDDIYLQKYPGEVLLKFPFEYADNNISFKKEMYLVRFLH